MIAKLKQEFETMSGCRRALLVWAAIGGTVYAAMPPLHGAVTAIGPVALWLWLLPSAAFGLDLLLAPDAAAGAVGARPAPSSLRRRRRGRAAISRRVRQRSDVQPDRRAG